MTPSARLDDLAARRELFTADDDHLLNIDLLKVPRRTSDPHLPQRHLIHTIDTQPLSRDLSRWTSRASSWT